MSTRIIWRIVSRLFGQTCLIWAMRSQGQAQHHGSSLECFTAYRDREVFEQPQRLHCTSIRHAEMEGATGPTRDAEVTASGLADHVDTRPACTCWPLMWRERAWECSSRKLGFGTGFNKRDEADVPS